MSSSATQTLGKINRLEIRLIEGLGVKGGARVRAVLRRSSFANEHGVGLQAKTVVGELVVDHAQHQLALAGQEVPLTPIEYQLLAYLAQDAGRVITQRPATRLRCRIRVAGII